MVMRTGAPRERASQFEAAEPCADNNDMVHGLVHSFPPEALIHGFNVVFLCTHQCLRAGLTAW
jgi:hypothetical protein